jgi:hypothetical protein
MGCSPGGVIKAYAFSKAQLIPALPEQIFALPLTAFAYDSLQCDQGH